MRNPCENVPVSLKSRRTPVGMRYTLIKARCAPGSFKLAGIVKNGARGGRHLGSNGPGLRPAAGEVISVDLEQRRHGLSEECHGKHASQDSTKQTQRLDINTLPAKVCCRSWEGRSADRTQSASRTSRRVGCGGTIGRVARAAMAQLHGAGPFEVPVRWVAPTRRRDETRRRRTKPTMAGVNP